MSTLEDTDPQIYAPPRILREERGDGSLVLRSSDPLADYEPTLVHSLRRWAAADPDHPLIAERDGDGWHEVGYGEAERAASAIGQGLLEQGFGPDRPLLVLSGNSVRHLLLTLGAMMAGVPVAPVSVAYSLQSADHERLKGLATLISPGGVYAENEAAFASALSSVPQLPRVSYDDLVASHPGERIAAAAARIGPDTTAKILFTSGSTGSPKGVVTTHRMLASNQQMMRQVWPFLSVERPLIVDWLPWSHTFGGSHNVGMMIGNGGALYIDDGRPAPGLFDKTVRNLTEVPPTIYFNVPAGYAQLVPILESDASFAETFFSRLRLLFNAAAALPPALRERLAAVAERTTGRRIPVTGSWGLTETAPAATNAHFVFDDARSIGVPLPGVELLLVPEGDAYELRVRGPMVTPGYVDRPDLTDAAFDDEGFYRTGDAVEPADPQDTDKGLLFRGRLAEDFKLATGTFVRVGKVRTRLLSAAPVLSDAVVTGENRGKVGALAWLNAVEARKLLGREPEGVDGEIVLDDELAEHLSQVLAQVAEGIGSAGRVERLLVMSRPADLDRGEITDKGYVNQRGVLASRSALVDRLYSEPAAPGVVVWKDNA